MISFFKVGKNDLAPVEPRVALGQTLETWDYSPFTKGKPCLVTNRILSAKIGV
jgi:hypothetical protein